MYCFYLRTPPGVVPAALEPGAAASWSTPPRDQCSLSSLFCWYPGERIIRCRSNPITECVGTTLLPNSSLIHHFHPFLTRSVLLLEVYPPLLSVCCLIHWSVVISYTYTTKLHVHAPIGAFVDVFILAIGAEVRLSTHTHARAHTNTHTHTHTPALQQHKLQSS